MSTRISPQKTSVEALIVQLGTAVRRKELLDRGFSDWHIRKSLASGTVQRISHGVYAVSATDPWAGHLARHQAVPSCFSKAKDMGLWVLHEPTVPHVGTAHGRPVPGCVAHRFKGKLSFWDMLRHCTQCGSDVEVLCVLESAVVKKKCTIAQLKREFGRRKDGRIRQLIALIDPQSMSIAETCARYHLLSAGHSVQIQYHVKEMGHLDAMVDGQLGLEIDGQEYHNDAKAWAEDLRRGNVLVVKAVPTLRFRAAVAMYYPKEMITWVERALRTISARR